MNIVFVSDLHLSPNTTDANNMFLQLLDKWVIKYDALYILGDFFDYWVGDDDKNNFTEMIKKALHKFTRQKPIYFIVGNHDFALGQLFAKQSGIKFIKDLTVLEVLDYRIMLSHGDIFCTLDKPYQRMKMVLQNKFILFLLKRLPLSIRYWIKNKLKQTNKKNYNFFNKENYYVVDSAIMKYALARNCNLVIHGHTHTPGLYSCKKNDIILQRYELPDWENRKFGGYLELNNGVFNLVGIN